VEIDWDSDEYERLTITAGTGWGEFVDQVQRRAHVIELAQSDDIKKMYEEKKIKDYTNVQSEPASAKKEEKRVKVDRDINDFFKDASGILNE